MSDSKTALSESRAITLEPGWLAELRDEFDQPYMLSLRQFLVAEKAAGKTIYPPGSQYFAALNTTPLDKVKVVILGQDPYHGPGQAHGLCFSVRRGVPLPPSLINIFKEIQDDLSLSKEGFHHGCLEGWAKQGVLLLNSVLTVERNKAGSHQGKGWETFTDRVVEVAARQERSLVFMLWGSYAQKKGAVIDSAKHKVLESSHPSPLSAHRGFFGCKHFSACNAHLQSNGDEPVDWRVQD